MVSPDDAHSTANLELSSNESVNHAMRRWRPSWFVRIIALKANSMTETRPCGRIHGEVQSGSIAAQCQAARNHEGGWPGCGRARFGRVRARCLGGRLA